MTTRLKRQGYTSPGGRGLGTGLPSPSPFPTSRSLSLVKRCLLHPQPQQGEGRLGSGSLTLGPQITPFHTPSPRRHMSRSVGTQTTPSRPSSASVPMANRSRWRRYVGPLRPYAVIQGWGRVGEASKGCCRHPQAVCIWDTLAVHPSLNLHLTICEMDFLESLGLDRQGQLHPLCSLQAAPKDPFLRAGPLQPRPRAYRAMRADANPHTTFGEGLSKPRSQGGN